MKRIIGHYAGAAINDALMCLEHAITDESTPIMHAEFPEGFICDECGRMAK